MIFNKGATFFLLGAGGDVWDLLLRQIFFSSLGLMLYFVFKVHKGHIREGGKLLSIFKQIIFFKSQEILYKYHSNIIHFSFTLFSGFLTLFFK
jgi:hypothetical protein